MENNQLNELVNKILPILLERDQLSTYLSVAGYCKDIFNIPYSDGEYLAIKLKQLNLAYFLRPNGDMRITPFGREIETNGGWARYIENQRLAKLLKENEAAQELNKAKQEKTRLEMERTQDRLIAMEERIQNATNEQHQIKLNERNVEIGEKSARASWFGGIIALFALVYSLYQGYRSNNQNEEITKLKIEIARVDSLLKIQQKAHMQTKLLPDSLPRRE